MFEDQLEHAGRRHGRRSCVRRHYPDVDFLRDERVEIADNAHLSAVRVHRQRRARLDRATPHASPR